MDPLFTSAQEEVQERFDELPSEIMDIIVGGTLDAVVFGITESFALTEEQVASLENEIILVLTFFVERSSFVSNVQESLVVNRNIAEAIGAEVQTEIFELVEEHFVAVEQEQNQTPKEPIEKIDTQPIQQKSDLQILAEKFAEKSRFAQQNSMGATNPVAVSSQNVKPAVPQLQKDRNETSQETVLPLRTMQRDINRVHGYGAYNEMLKNEGEVHSSKQDTVLKKEG